MASLGKAHSMKTLKGRCLHSMLANQDHLPVIRKAVALLNLLKLKAQMAVEHLIDTGQFQLLIPAIYGATNNNGGVLFFQGLLLFLKNGNSKSEVIIPIVDTIRPFVINQPNMSISRAVEALAKVMDTDFSNLVVGKLDIVRAKYETLLPGNAEIEAAEIIARYGNPQHATLELFNWFNNQLPVPFKHCPRSAIRHGFMSFTEEAMVELLGSKSVGSILGISADGGSRAIMKKIPKGLLLRTLFLMKGKQFKKIDLLKDLNENSRYILGISFQTDGFEVQFRAYDLRSTPPKKVKSSNFTAAKSYKPSAMPADLAEDLASNKYTLVGVDIGAVNAIGACIYPAGSVGKKIYFTKKSKVLTFLTIGIIRTSKKIGIQYDQGKICCWKCRSWYFYI
jgi:hypothetical protein